MNKSEILQKDGRTYAERVALFLEFACWDHQVHGKGDHRMYDRAAQRLLEHRPEIARNSLYTAVVCGELEEVKRILAERPELANKPGGSRGPDWAMTRGMLQVVERLGLENLTR